ncbi:MAG: O-antigen ligase family protein [Patescibacteria group bacterium]
MSEFWQAKKTVDFLVRGLKIILYGTPALFLLASEYFIYPFVSTKVFVFRILVEIMAAMYLWLALIAREYRPRQGPLSLALGAYFIIQFLSGVFGVNFYRSWVGNFERMDGLLTQLHYLVFFIILSAVLRKKSDWTRFAGVGLIINVLLFIVAILQVNGVPIYHFGATARVTGSFGNSAYFASYLIFSIYLGIFFFFRESGWKKNILGLYLALAHIALFLTQTRGAVIGWAAGLVVFFTLRIWFGADKRRRGLALLPVLALIIGAWGLYTFRDAAAVRKIGAIRRLASISITDGTTISRLRYWQMAVDGWKEKPLLGWGYGQFEVISNRYYNPSLYDFEEWTDHAHNYFLDVLSTTGLLGLLAYLAIFSIAIDYARRNYLEKKISSLEFALIIGFLVAYLIQNVFIFDMYASFVGLFAFFAFLEFSRGNGGEEKKFALLKNGRYLIWAGFLIAVFAIYRFNFIPMKAGYYATRALKYSALAGDYLGYVKKAIAIPNFGSQEINYQLTLERAQFIMDKFGDGVSSEQIAGLLALAEEQFKFNIAREPVVLRNYLGLAYVYLTEAKLDSANAQILAGKALDIINQGEPLSPRRQSLFFLKAEAYNGLNRSDEALALLEKTIALDNSYADAYINYAKVATYISNREKLTWVFEEAEKNKIEFSREDLQNLLNIAVYKKDLWAAVDIYLKLTELEPDNPRFHSGLAAAYAEAGDSAGAIAAAKRAMELDPEFVAEGQMFINNLSRTKK